MSKHRKSCLLREGAIQARSREQGYFHLLGTASNNQGMPDSRRQGWDADLGSLSQPGWGRGSEALSEPVMNHRGCPGKVGDEGLERPCGVPGPAWQSAGASFPPDGGGGGLLVQRFSGCFSLQRAEHFRRHIIVQRCVSGPPALHWCEQGQAAPPGRPLVLKTQRVILNCLLSLHHESRCLLAQECVIR